MPDPTIHAPGRTITVGKAVIALNPNVFHSPLYEVAQVPKKRVKQQSKPLSNSLERAWGEDLAKRNPGAPLYEQAITFTLANGVRYTPDWVMMRDCDWFAYEVKGKHAWDDAIVKVKVAARMYPKIGWVLVWRIDGDWHTQVLLP